MAATAPPRKLSPAEEVALQQAGQYAGSATPVTSANAQDIGLDPEQGFINPKVGASEPPPTTWNPAPILKQVLETQVPGMPPLWQNQPDKQPSQNGQKTEAAPLKIPGAVLAEDAPQVPGAVLADEPPAQKEAPPQIPGAVLAEPAEPQQPAQAPQPTAPMPSGTGAGAPSVLTPPRSPTTYLPIAEDQPGPGDPHSQTADLIAQGKSPGEAQAIAAGQQPKTLAGKTPAPQTTTVIPPPLINGKAPIGSPPPAEAKPPAPVDTLKADEKNRVDPTALYSYLLGKFANSGLVGYVPPDGERWGIKTGSAAEWAAFGLAVAKQESDLNARSWNAADPGGSAGLFQFGQGQTQFTGGRDQFDPQASADAFVRAVEHFLANKGSVANMGKTFGSILRPNEAGQYIAGAQKVAAGGSGKDLVSSGGGGSSGGEKGSRATAKTSDPFAGQPLFSIPTAPGSGAEPRPPQPQSMGDGGGDRSRQVLEQPSEGSTFFFPSFGGDQQPRQQQQERARSAPPAEDQQAQQNPLITALTQRGFTPAQAQQFAQGIQAITPGKGIGPLKTTAPPAPSAITPVKLSLTTKQPVTHQILSPKQLTPGKAPKIVPEKGPAPAAPGPKPQVQAPTQQQAASTIDPTVIAGLMKRGFSREQAIAFANKATVSQPGQANRPTTPAPVKQTAPPPPAPSGVTPPPQEQKTQPAPQEPSEYTGRPAGSTHGNPIPPGHEQLSQIPKLIDQAKHHASILSPDDPRVKRQSDGKIKGEHFVEGDPFHEKLLSGLPYGKQGRQRGILGQAEQAIAESRPMHISYISSPAEAALYPTRESRTTQYEKHSPEERLMGTTEGQLVGHSFIPVSVGITPSKKASEPHESVIHGISTNVLANNFQHINQKLAEMGRSTPYKEFGAKFSNDLEGYLSNLNAGHTGTGRGHAVGTAEHPNTPDENHVPYHLTRREADFINATINNTAAFSQHEDGKALRRLAEANGTLITPEGETNRLLHEIELQDPGWSGRGSGKRGRVLEPSIRSFKTGLIHEVHPSEEHMPATIRPGKQYQDITKAVHRTSQRGRPDIPISISPRSQPPAGIRRDLAHNQKINRIEREFSEDRINESQARKLLEAIGENPEEYRFVGGSGGLITPYEDDPEAITHEEHTQMKDNLRKQWVGGKIGVEDYRRKVAEVPLPAKPSKPVAAAPAAAPEETALPPKPIVPTKPKPPKPVPESESVEAEEKPETPPAAPEPVAPAPKPKPAPKAPPEPMEQPEEAEPTAPPKPPAPDEPLPPVKAVKPAAVKPPVTAPAKLPKLVKPKDAEGEWKGVPEEHKQAYLEEKVKRTMANQVLDKATHKLEVKRDEKGGVQYDPNGSPVYVQHDYDIANSPMLKKKALGQIKNADEHEDTLGNLIGPDGKEVIDPETGKPTLKHAHLNQTERRRLSAMHTASAVHTMGDKIFDSYNEAIKNPDIAAGEGWYSRMRKRLADALGEHHELFAQLLGATSAKTPVRTNFINALDAFEQYKEGKFQKHIEKFLEAHGKLQEGEGALTQHMRDTGILKKEDPDHESDADAMAHWIRHHKILPLKKTGSKYSANSNAVLKVLAGTWLKEVGAPKTPNFAGNLTGRTLEATIDVWAARHLQRLGYEGHTKGPWRAQSAAEPGVSNIDFAFSQDAMRHAADRISKETGKQLNPDDLQAILWFAEKHHYDDRGWTSKTGAEKSSFDEVADKVFGKDGQPHEKPMDSTQLQAHYAAEAKALQQRKGKITTAQSYLGTPHEQTKLPAYMLKHGLTHEEVHGAGEGEEEEAA